MYGIDILMKEHENILVFTDFLRSISADLLEGKPEDAPLLRECLEFATNYADCGKANQEWHAGRA